MTEKAELKKTDDLPGLEFDEDSYHESEDEDFDPNKELDTSTGGLPASNSIKGSDVGSPENSDSDDDGSYNDEDNEEEKKYNSIVSESGGLIKTRRARLQEEQDALKNKYEKLDVGETSEGSLDLWAKLKQRAYERARFNGSVMDHEAGSNDKKATNNGDQKQQSQQQSQQKRPQGKNDSGLPLKRHLKRPPILEQIISGALKPKLTTLEKSKLDWATYVDKEGIHEELNLHNKDGYLAKQDFLNRVESSKDEKYREIRKLQLLQSEQQK
ncbi:swr complex subunit [Kluyveromyces marxianus]|nr:swr complex subunit [Kluyveromyces marxianus]